MKVFISYRREDSPGHAGRLRDALRREFGTEHVFMDLDSIPSGTRFAERIDEAVAATDAVLVLIGPRWLDARSADGARRLDDSEDWVRNEVESGLRSGKPVVPVLVASAALPKPGELPESLRGLVAYNAAEVTEKRWDYDVAQLIADLKRVMHTGHHEPLERLRGGSGRGRVLGLGLGIAALAIVAVVIALLASGGAKRSPQHTLGATGGAHAFTASLARIFSVSGLPFSFSYPASWGTPQLDSSNYWDLGPRGADGKFDYGMMFVASGAPDTHLTGQYAAMNVTSSHQTADGIPLTLLDFDLPKLNQTHQRSWIFTAHGASWSINCYWYPTTERLVAPTCAKSVATLKLGG